MPPLGFFVHRVLRDRTERPNSTAIDTDASRRNSRPWGFVHEWHELVGEAGHGAADADAAYVWATANSGHPSPFRYVTVDHRPPASEFHDALGGTVDLREIALLVVARSVATVVHRCAEKPCGTQLIVQRNHGSEAGHLIEEVQHRLHKVVGLYRTSGNIHDWQSSF